MMMIYDIDCKETMTLQEMMLNHKGCRTMPTDQKPLGERPWFWAGLLIGFTLLVISFTIYFVTHLPY